MSQYYSDYFIQRKGQEVIESKMREPFKEAIQAFAKQNQGLYPTTFIIYRDGVSDAQRG
jgi:hypothetical protein